MREAVWIPSHVARHSSFGSSRERNVGRVQLGIPSAIVHVKHTNTGNHLLAILREPTTTLSRFFFIFYPAFFSRDSCNGRNWDGI